MAATMKNAPSAVVGLDIGSESIKVSEARLTKDGVIISGLGIAQTPVGVFQDEIVVDPATLGAAVKMLLASSGIKTRKCVSSIEGQNKVVVRVIEVPKMEDKELSESMKWEVDRQVPFAATNEIEMDYAAIPSESDDLNIQTMEVLLAVAQKDVVESHVAALRAAGLKPYAIDLAQLAAERSLVELVPIDPNVLPEDSVVAIISIGARNTEMGIFENGTLTFPCPPIPIAGDTITNEIAEALGLSPEEAEQTKKEYASVDLESMAGYGPEGSEEPTTYDQGFYMPTDTAFSMSEPEDSYHSAVTPMDDESPKATFDLGAELGFPQFDDTSSVSPAKEEVTDSFDGFDLGADAVDKNIVPVNLDQAVGEDIEEDKVVSTAFVLDYDLSELEPAVTHVVHTAAPGATKDAAMVAQVSDAISGVLIDLANEIRRSMEYYSVKYNNTPSKVFLCGGTAKIPNLAEFLTRELGVPVEVANPLANIPCHVPSMSDFYIKDLAPIFSVSVGLAIRDMIG